MRLTSHTHTDNLKTIQWKGIIGVRLSKRCNRHKTLVQLHCIGLPYYANQTYFIFFTVRVSEINIQSFYYDEIDKRTKTTYIILYIFYLQNLFQLQSSGGIFF